MRRYGLLLYRLVPLMYGICIASYLLNQWFYRYDYLGRIESIRDIPEFLVLVAIAGKQLSGLGMAFVLLAIAQTIINAVQLKMHQISRVETSGYS